LQAARTGSRCWRGMPRDAVNVYTAPRGPLRFRRTPTNTEDLCGHSITETVLFSIREFAGEARRIPIPSKVEVRDARRNRIGKTRHSRPKNILGGIRRSFHQEFHTIPKIET